MLNNINVIGFKEVYLTPTHLCIVMEYAAGGELFDRIVKRLHADAAPGFGLVLKLETQGAIRNLPDILFAVLRYRLG